MDDWDDDWEGGASADDAPTGGPADAAEAPSAPEAPSEDPAGGPGHSTEGRGDDHEDAVRRYLTWIEDPSSLRDESRIADLQAKIDAARDPIEKIHLASDLHRAQQVDGARVRHEFVAVARRWAEASGIVPEAFLQLGVPAEDLRQAGFDVPTHTTVRRSETGTVGPSTTPTAGRSARVTIDAIRAAARAFDAPFTTADLRDRVGGSPGTVRKALDAMVDDGEVEHLGPAEDWPGPGRPPHLYRSTR